MQRALIIGAGIVGCASAWRLAKSGFAVTVLERATVGEDAASTAAAGMLGAQIEAHAVPAMQALCVQSRDVYPAFVEAVATESGCPVELRQTGALRVAYDEATLDLIREDVALQHQRGLEARTVTGDEVARMEPRLSRVRGAGLFVRDGVVEPRQLLHATRVAAANAGACFEERREVCGLSFSDRGEVDGVVTATGEPVRADVVVIAAGSWSTRIDGVERLGVTRSAVQPVRGQMIELAAAEPWLGRIVEGPVAYLSPREDGRMLVGSTVERVGFARAVTAGAIARLLAEAIRMVPDLESAEILRTWCGFRAEAPDGLPILDRRGNVIFATGHYRNGIVLAPVTAAVVASLARGEAPEVDVSAYSVARLGDLREERTSGHVS